MFAIVPVSLSPLSAALTHFECPRYCHTLDQLKRYPAVQSFARKMLLACAVPLFLRRIRELRKIRLALGALVGTQHRWTPCPHCHRILSDSQKKKAACKRPPHLQILFDIYACETTTCFLSTICAKPASITSRPSSNCSSVTTRGTRIRMMLLLVPAVIVISPCS
jgi:hypothetical protein